MKNNISNPTLDSFVLWLKRNNEVTNAFWAIVPDDNGEPRYSVFITYECDGIPYQFAIAESVRSFRKKTSMKNTEDLKNSYKYMTNEINDYHITYLGLKEALNEINREHGYTDRVNEEKAETQKKDR